MSFPNRINVTTSRAALLALLLTPACTLDTKVGGNPDDTGDDPSSGSEGAGTTASGTTPSDSTTSASATEGPADTDDQSSTTTPGDPTGTGPQIPPCIVVETVLELDEVGPGGFSGEQLLAGKLGPRASTLQFVDEPTTFSEQWKGKALPVTVELRHEGGAIVWIDSEVNPEYEDQDEGISPDEECNDGIEVEVEIDFVTEAGEFAETRVAILRASTVERASLQVELTPAVMGSFDHTTLYDDPDWKSISVSLSGTWDGDKAGGVLNNAVELVLDEVIGFGSIARWGDEIELEFP